MAQPAEQQQQQQVETSEMLQHDFNIVDTVVLIAYFAVVLATSVFAMCNSKRDTAKGYFLAGRFVSFIPVGMSLFATNIGSEHFIGLAGSGAATGLAAAAFELNVIFVVCKFSR